MGRFHFADREKIAEEHAVLVDGLAANGSDPPVSDETGSLPVLRRSSIAQFVNPKNGVGVADIKNQKHGSSPPKAALFPKPQCGVLYLCGPAEIPWDPGHR